MDKDLPVVSRSTKLIDQLQTGHSRHVVIRDHKVKTNALFYNQFARLLSIFNTLHLMPLAFQGNPHDNSNRWIIIRT